MRAGMNEHLGTEVLRSTDKVRMRARQSTESLAMTLAAQSAYVIRWSFTEASARAMTGVAR